MTTGETLGNTDAQLISFDLWLTLIRSNGTDFKDARNAYFGQELAPDVPTPEFDLIVRSQDKLADQIAEERGRDVLFQERVRMVADYLGKPEPSDETLDGLYAVQARLFEQHPPTLLEPDTLDILDDLAREHKLAAVSNTGYIHGDEMRKTLKALGIADRMSHMVFSNEVGFAKPDSRIFVTLLDQAGVEASDALHVGDNPRADVQGANQLGMRALLLAKGTTIKDLL